MPCHSETRHHAQRQGPQIIAQTTTGSEVCAACELASTANLYLLIGESLYHIIS